MPKNIVVITLGDPHTGYIPSPEEQERALAVVAKALQDAGRDDVVLAVPYTWNIWTLMRTSNGIPVSSKAI